MRETDRLSTEKEVFMAVISEIVETELVIVAEEDTRLEEMKRHEEARENYLMTMSGCD